jgi:hypothetical protein
MDADDGNHRDNNQEGGDEENPVFAALRDDDDNDGAPAAVATRTLRSIVAANPALLRERNQRGLLPLHLAILQGRPASVVRCFLRAWPESDRRRGPVAPGAPCVPA